MSTQALDGKVEGRPRPAPVREARRVWSSNPAVVLWGTMVGKSSPRAPALGDQRLRAER